MTITATVIEDSVGVDAPRLTTFQLRYPRFIHAELMTHRVFSRNASSSRAIPVKKLIADIVRDTAMPMYWGSNKPGMQAGEEINDKVCVAEGEWIADTGVWDSTPIYKTREEAWMHARDNAIKMAEAFDAAGYHKQIVNRLLEPFSHINTLVTSTDWANWNGLRDHPDAQPEIRVLAKAMIEAKSNSAPALRIHEVSKTSAWHLPYMSTEEREKETVLTLARASAARCARVSYLTHDMKQPNIKDDLKLYSQLMEGVIKHASPTEHQAKADLFGRLVNDKIPLYTQPYYHGNFRGWIQFRKTIIGENIND